MLPAVVTAALAAEDLLAALESPPGGVRPQLSDYRHLTLSQRGLQRGFMTRMNITYVKYVKYARAGLVEGLGFQGSPSGGDSRAGRRRPAVRA